MLSIWMGLESWLLNWPHPFRLCQGDCRREEDRKGCAVVAFVLSIPVWIGAVIAMALTTACGLLIYALTHRFIARYQSYELKDPITSLFRMVGILVSLMLSLAFSEVISERKAIKKAIDREAVAISDIFATLQLYDDEGVREIQKILIDYTRAIVDDDWPAMADGHYGQKTSELKKMLVEKILSLKPVNSIQNEIRASILVDIDAVSDYRLIRLNHARSTPPVYVFVIIFGFLISMACFGAYRPQVPLIALVSLYTAFIGLVLYLVMSLSDPFHGSNIIDPTPFEHLVEVLASAR